MPEFTTHTRDGVAGQFGSAEEADFLYAGTGSNENTVGQNNGGAGVGIGINNQFNPAEIGAVFGEEEPLTQEQIDQLSPEELERRAENLPDPEAPDHLEDFGGDMETDT